MEKKDISSLIYNNWVIKLIQIEKLEKKEEKKNRRKKRREKKRGKRNHRKNSQF